MHNMMKHITVLLLSIITNFIVTSAFISSRGFIGRSSSSITLQATVQRAEEGARKQIWKVQRADHISDWTTASTQQQKMYPNPLSLKPNVPPSWFIGLNDAVAAKVQVNAVETVDEVCLLPESFFDNDNDEIEEECEVDRGINAVAFTLAGPRAEIAFDPMECKAAVVTCGGICPGLNTVVKEVIMCLRRQYGITETFGIPAGYRGFLKPETWRSLDEDAVKDLHNQGGTILGTSRGGHDTKGIVDSLVEQKINLLFIVGGDGTVRGAVKVADEIKKRGLPIAVAVIPKTIDNDIPLLDRTFGFETAVEAARDAIDVANVEAEGFPKGLGIVKVMGRNSGFIAMHSALGSGYADLCLVPEVDFYLDGDGGILNHLYERLVANDKAIVVVAEGAGQTLLEEMGASGDVVKDASGNVLLDDIGPWLCQQLKKRIDEKLEKRSSDDANAYSDKVSLKYVDPSYMVRGIQSNTADNLFCLQLAHNAVHGAMAGLSGFIVGSINTRECYIPIEMVANKRNVIDISHQSLWEYVVFSTGQPSFQNDDNPDDDVITTASGGVILSDLAP